MANDDADEEEDEDYKGGEGEGEGDEEEDDEFLEHIVAINHVDQLREVHRHVKEVEKKTEISRAEMQRRFRERLHELEREHHKEETRGSKLLAQIGEIRRSHSGPHGPVRVFDERNLHSMSAIGSHACSHEARRRVTNDIPLHFLTGSHCKLRRNTEGPHHLDAQHDLKPHRVRSSIMPGEYQSPRMSSMMSPIYSPYTPAAANLQQQASYTMTPLRQAENAANLPPQAAVPLPTVLPLQVNRRIGSTASIEFPASPERENFEQGVKPSQGSTSLTAAGASARGGAIAGAGAGAGVGADAGAGSGTLSNVVRAWPSNGSIGVGGAGAGAGVSAGAGTYNLIGDGAGDSDGDDATPSVPRGSLQTTV
jgi:hypothetical protein